MVSQVAVGDVHEPAEGAVGVADGQWPADEQHAGAGLVAGVGVDDADPLAAGDVAQLEAAAGGLEDLEDAAVDHRPLGGEQRLVVGEQPVTGGEELAEHAVFVEHDVTRRTAPSRRSVEQLALVDLVDDLRRQLAPRRRGDGGAGTAAP